MWIGGDSWDRFESKQPVFARESMWRVIVDVGDSVDESVFWESVEVGTAAANALSRHVQGKEAFIVKASHTALNLVGRLHCGGSKEASESLLGQLLVCAPFWAALTLIGCLEALLP